MSLTVAIPTFNPEPAHLREALESVAQQSSVSQIEVLIADNGSDGDTAEAIAGLAAEFPTFDFRRHDTNLGYDGNLLRLARDVTTDYIWFFGDDDLLFPSALDAMLDAIRSNPDAAVLLASPVFFHDRSELDEVTPRIGQTPVVTRGDDFVSRSQFTAAALSTLCMSVHSIRATDLEFAAGTNWTHFAAMLIALNAPPTLPAVLILDELVAVRRSNRARWFSNFGNQYRSGLLLIDMIASGRRFGISDDAYRFYLDKRYATNLIDIITLAWPLSRAERRQLSSMAGRHFAGRARFRIVDEPVLHAPNWMRAMMARSISLAGAARRLGRRGWTTTDRKVAPVSE